MPPFRQWLTLMENIQPGLWEDAERVVRALSAKYPMAGPVVLKTEDSPDNLARHGGGNIYLSTINWNAATLAQYEKEWSGLAVDPTPSGTITHEFGHALASRLERQLGHDKFWGIVYRWLDVGPKDNLVLSNDQGVSPYACENIFEFLAEAFVTFDSKGAKIAAGAFEKNARRIALGVWTDLLHAR